LIAQGASERAKRASGGFGDADVPEVQLKWNHDAEKLGFLLRNAEKKAKSEGFSKKGELRVVKLEKKKEKKAEDENVKKVTEWLERLGVVL
jgi:valyl-tRNA synthetase